MDVPTINRRLSLTHLGLGLGAGLGGLALAATSDGHASAGARAVTLTFLQSRPGQLALLERFVRANWFAMDEVAVQQGLFVAYEWLDTAGDDGPWNAIVVVTYQDRNGFVGIRDRWALIKAAHDEVRPDGLPMKDLGRVVDSKTLFERAPFVSKRSTTVR